MTESVRDIVSVGEQGIVFSDGTDILFSECVRNFRAVYPTESDCVAERDVTAEPPYFEFFTSPERLRIVFDYSGIFADSKNKKAFHDLYFQILDSGFSTFDLS